MPRLDLLHLHQRFATLDERETFLDAVQALSPSPDLIALITCHRVELYAAIPADAEPRSFFARRLGIGVDGAALSHDADAARHLFRVACGLDSAVRGEGQILGQVRRTFDEARAARRLDPALALLFQRALHLGREVRAATALGSVRRTIGSLAVDELARCVGDLGAATVLVVGAGEIGKLAARALGLRARRLVVANRDAARAAAVAGEVGATAVGLDAIDAALAEADAVVSAADTRGSLLTVERLRARLARGPLALVDVAVPRSVGAQARALAGLTYRSVDDLGAESDPEIAGACAEAERRCELEAAAFDVDLRGRAAAAAIRALRERGEHLRREKLARALSRLGHLDERDRRVVEALSASLVNAILHQPTIALRNAPDRADAAVDLFDLEARR